MLWPLLISIAGFIGLIGTLTLMNLKNQILRREINRPWVTELLTTKEMNVNKEAN